MSEMLANKIAVVTGAGTGIGKAIAQELAVAGALVAVTDINLEWAQSVVEEITSIGREAISLKLDVTQPNDIESSIQTIVSQWGKLDIWCNNAGMSTMNHFINLTERDWDYNMNVNAKGTFLCSQYAARQMIMQEPDRNNGLRGKIINISSTAGKTGNVPFLAAYIASKFAVVGLTQATANELASHGITVNSVCPGYVKTSMQERELKWESKLRGITLEEVKQLYIEDTPLARLEAPVDVARVVLFLASTASDFITGASICVNGGAWMD